MLYFTSERKEGMEQDHKKLVRERILTDQSFVRAVFSGQQKGTLLAWGKVVVRPVEIKGERNLQFSYFDEKKGCYQQLSRS